jgi:xylose isomerase
VGLEIAQRIISDGKIPGFVKKRYSSFNSGNGAKFEKGELSLEELAAIGSAGYGKTGVTSGKQEYLENVFNQYLLGL